MEFVSTRKNNKKMKKNNVPLWRALKPTAEGFDRGGDAGAGVTYHSSDRSRRGRRQAQMRVRGALVRVNGRGGVYPNQPWAT